jgi:hypothetical protein
MKPTAPRPRRSHRARVGWILAAGVFLAGQAYLFLCFAAWAGASLPYQDGPPDLLRKQQHDVEAGWREVKTAAVVAAVSSLWLAVKVVRARAARKSPQTDLPS